MFSALARARRSLSFRLTLWHAALLLAAAITALGAVYLQLRQLTIAREHETIELRLGFLEALYSSGGVESVADLVARAERNREAAFFVQIADAANHTVFSSGDPHWKQYTDGRIENAPIPSPGAQEWAALHGHDGSLTLAARRLEDGGVIRVGRATPESRRVQRAFGRIALTSLLVVFPISLVSGWLIGRRALRPLSALTATIQDIVATGRFSSRVESRGTGDEIDELVVYFNAMLERIEKLMTGLSESLDFAAHDLRTPLTRLRNAAEAALREPSSREDLLDALAGCVEESERVLVTVRRLIELAAAEGGVAKFERTAVDFGRLATEVVGLFEEIAESKEVDVSIDAQGDLVALADPDAMQRVFSNLVDNAIKYTNPGTCVDLRVRREASHVVLQVSDRGDGIRAEDLPHIWSRLFRAHASSDTPGSGLGLSIVKAIVEAHRGSVEVRSTPGRGSVFTVRMPVA